MYFIACFEKDGTENVGGFADFGAMRTFGYMSTFAEAEKALNENWCDMFECLYRYAVIEKIEPGKVKGLVSKKEDRKWFLYDRERDGFFQIEEPGAHEYTKNFAFC